MNTKNKKGRTLAITVADLLESPRLKIAVDNFNEDPNLLRAIFIELGMESQNVAKNAIIRESMKHIGLDKGELKPVLYDFNNFCTYNIWWNMTPIEVEYYSKNPKGLLPKEEAKELFRKIKLQFGVE